MGEASRGGCEGNPYSLMLSRNEGNGKAVWTILVPEGALNPLEPLLSLAQLRDKNAVEERLKTIAAQLIAAHRRKDHALVVPYARQAGLATGALAAHQLFMKTIQVFHPDRLSVLWDQIGRALDQGDRQALEALVLKLEYRTEAPRSRRVAFGASEAEPADEPEVYQWAPAEDEEDEGPGWDEEEWDPDAGTFFSAVKRELFGGLDLYPDAADLGKLEGELDLSGYDLNDLDGIEFCTGLSSLNLAQNHIDNVYSLKDLVKLEALDLAENDLEDADWLAGLVNLKELDLSANDIDDVAFLARLPRLIYVDLSGNPVRNRALLARLEARGVIVIL